MVVSCRLPAVSSAVTAIFSNDQDRVFATRVEIDGRLASPDVSAGEAIIHVLRNAFIEAFQPVFENPVPGEQPQ